MDNEGNKSTWGSAGDPIHLGRGPHLFIDDFLIQYSAHLARTPHQLERLPEPVIPKAEIWHQQPLLFVKVIYYPHEALFRAWYNVKNPGFSSPVHAYAESTNGVRWTRPNLGLIEMGGSRENNLFLEGGGFGLGFIDDGPACKDSLRRYKMASFEHPGKGRGLCVAFSQDGLHWERYTHNPVLPHYDSKHPLFAESVGDIIDAFYDPIRDRYVATFGMYATPADGYVGESRTGCIRRLVGQSHSKDFVHWSKPRRILLPDDRYDMTEFYGMSAMVRGDLYIGVVRVLRDDLAADPGGDIQGIGFSQLAVSHDGEHWTRCRDLLCDRNHEPGTWDHAIAWMSAPVYVDDRMFFYYGGYSAGHKIGDRQIGLGLLRRDGYVSRDGRGHESAILGTPGVILEGQQMDINANAKGGEVRAQILDKDLRPTPGYSFADCDPVIMDSVSHRMTWRGESNLAPLAEGPVHIEFLIREAELYAFELR